MALIQCDFRSEVLQMQMSMRVVLPNDKPVKDAPVVYLLHGLSDNSTGWTRYTSIERYAFDNGVVVIMPEVQRSFYTNTKNGMNYFEHITEELPLICKHYFNITSDPKKTYIMGLSMGGYGAIKSALTFPEKYAGCASFSGAVDVADPCMRDVLRLNGEYNSVFGDKPNDNDDLFYLASHTKQTDLPILMYCGTEDSLHPMNIKLKDHLKTNNWNINYDEWTGIHSWKFWDESIQKAFSYFFNNETR